MFHYGIFTCTGDCTHTHPITFFWLLRLPARLLPFPCRPSSFMLFFIRFHIWDKIHDIFHPVSSLFQSTWWSPRPFIPKNTSFHSFLCPNKVPSCICTTFYISFRTSPSSADGHLGWTRSLAIVNGTFAGTGMWAVRAAWLIGVNLLFVELICLHRYDT